MLQGVAAYPVAAGFCGASPGWPVVSGADVLPPKINQERPQAAACCNESRCPA